MSFDTTAVNTGRIKGVKDKSVASKLINPDQISSYLLRQLTVHHPRSDYKELISLCLIFLERFPSENIVFAAPGAFHHARWMAKAIYSLKINLFREQFQLTNFEKQGFHDICLFIINIYVKVWLNAPKSALAPNQDLQLLKSLVNYNKVNKFISDISVSKFINHLWYLNPEQAVFSLFDDSLSNCVKKRMATKLISQANEDEELDDYCDMKPLIKLNEVSEILDKNVDHFISSQSINFLKRFNINDQFLHTNPELWSNNEEYLKSKKIVDGLKVTNDTAERGVKLITDYNSCITKDEKQKQFLLQVIAECRTKFPCCSKASLSEPLPFEQ
ncbi:hypothetical protein HELRODRAFT_173812 [Helobdella robusta]|uniref:Uncharacterized protein n=1 Tax=Helobdella robusta TaxID=6412 RepID=T1F795_HELRO|nr:hypothetical protein HELRODRAFT_173812 [Helobdella robusta]ESO02978.1 hypothetical protein HELRODRAFT_173812 [Helobdella robusta]